MYQMLPYKVSGMCAGVMSIDATDLVGAIKEAAEYYGKNIDRLKAVVVNECLYGAGSPRRDAVAVIGECSEVKALAEQLSY